MTKGSFLVTTQAATRTEELRSVEAGRHGSKKLQKAGDANAHMSLPLYDCRGVKRQKTKDADTTK